MKRLASKSLPSADGRRARAENATTSEKRGEGVVGANGGNQRAKDSRQVKRRPQRDVDAEEEAPLVLQWSGSKQHRRTAPGHNETERRAESAEYRLSRGVTRGRRVLIVPGGLHEDRGQAQQTQKSTPLEINRCDGVQNESRQTAPFHRMSHV